MSEEWRGTGGGASGQGGKDERGVEGEDRGGAVEEQGVEGVG